jgi:hypothetical protein
MVEDRGLARFVEPDDHDVFPLSHRFLLHSIDQGGRILFGLAATRLPPRLRPLPRVATAAALDVRGLSDSMAECRSYRVRERWIQPCVAVGSRTSSRGRPDHEVL